MDGTTIISILSLTGILVGRLGGIIVSSKMTNYRFEQLQYLDSLFVKKNDCSERHERTEKEINEILI